MAVVVVQVTTLFLEKLQRSFQALQQRNVVLDEENTRLSSQVQVWQQLQLLTSEQTFDDAAEPQADEHEHQQRQQPHEGIERANNNTTTNNKSNNEDDDEDDLVPSMSPVGSPF
jgi:hypothetical protein